MFVALFVSSAVSVIVIAFIEIVCFLTVKISKNLNIGFLVPYIRIRQR